MMASYHLLLAVFAPFSLRYFFTSFQHCLKLNWVFCFASFASLFSPLVHSFAPLARSFYKFSHCLLPIYKFTHCSFFKLIVHFTSAFIDPFASMFIVHSTSVFTTHFASMLTAPSISSFVVCLMCKPTLVFHFACRVFFIFFPLFVVVVTSITILFFPFLCFVFLVIFLFCYNLHHKFILFSFFALFLKLFVVFFCFLFYCVWSFVVVGCMLHHYGFFCTIALHLDLLLLNSLLMRLASQVFFSLLFVLSLGLFVIFLCFLIYYVWFCCCCRSHTPSIL